MVVFGKVVDFGQKWLLSGKSGCIRDKSGCIRANWLYSVKDVEYGQKWFFLDNVVVFGHSGWIRVKCLYSGKIGCIGA